MILLEAQAGGGRYPDNALGAGHIFLTSERILWFERRPYWLFRVLHMGKWLTGTVEIDRSSIRRSVLRHYGPLGTILEIETDGFMYRLRVARDYFLLRGQSATARQWLDCLQPAP